MTDKHLSFLILISSVQALRVGGHDQENRRLCQLDEKTAIDSIIYFCGVRLRGVAGWALSEMREGKYDSCFEGNLMV